MASLEPQAANRNQQLTSARAARKDEFYTQLVDIEREMRYYRHDFKGKVVYCNCDDPFVSAFFEYFAKNFEHFGLKKLVTTCFKSRQIDAFSKNDSDRAIKLEYSGGASNNLPTPDDIGITTLDGDGDFRSRECLDILEDADVVVTNPPFSLFKEYVGQLASLGKKFIVIGHQNAITYKVIFPLIKDNQMWLGYGFNRNVAHFVAPHYEDTASDADHREGLIRVSGVMWFTNLDTRKRHEEVILVKRYHGNESAYPEYDNYHAVEVAKSQDIPMDYAGVMGVPVTFLTKYNPDQFEIVGTSDRGGDGLINHLYKEHHRRDAPVINGTGVYKRIFIRNRHVVELRTS